MSRFQFKKFTIYQSRSALKVGTDAMLLGASIKVNSPKYGLDIGAGTGVLSLMVAQNHPEIFIDAIEIDPSSFEDLTENILLSDFKNQIQTIQKDFFSCQFIKKFDLIFSNPPFYDDGLKFDQNVIYHSKHSINFSANNFFLKSKELLDVHGELWIIVPFDKTKFWVDTAIQSSLNVVKQIIIEAKPDKKVRSILVFSFDKNQIINISKFVVRDSNGYYTQEYHQLTNDFHNKRPLK
jgi:tRNA1Val (adenine37-N6)-methyltransferase